MKWQNSRRSDNVIDNRKKTSKIGIIGGIVATIIGFVSGIFIYGPKLPNYITSNIDDINQIQAVTYNYEEHLEFIRTMLGITEDKWAEIFKSKKMKWTTPKLILFTDKTKSGCGDADSNIGPFYCSADYTVYLDLDFFKLMEKNLKIPGDAAQAYVIFHEVGHHVQTITGILPRIYSKMAYINEIEANKLSTRLELQADCYAGIIFNKSKSVLEPGDIAETINAAARIGDDWLQSRSGTVMPDTFTHGTSEQRAGWVLYGYKHGNLEDCDTFTQTDNIIKI